MEGPSEVDLLGHRLAVLEALARPQQSTKPLVERIAALQARLDAVEQQIPEARMLKDSLKRLPMDASKLRSSHEAVLAKLVVVLGMGDQVNAMSAQLNAIRELEPHMNAENFAGERLRRRVALHISFHVRLACLRWMQI